MDWEKYKVGSTVTCGFCKIEDATVKDVGIYSGGVGFELSCGHRNGFCDECQMLVKDTSDQPTVISASCPNCSE